MPKACEFYALRGALALVTAACEAHWLESLRRRLGPRLTQWAHFFLLVSPGTFAASAAFLPSAFAMCCLLLCQSWQLRRQGGAAVLAGGAACVVGWPFAAVALLPVGLDLVVKHGLAQCVQWGLMALAATAAPTLVADSWFYVGFQWLGRGSSSDEEGSSGGGGMVFSTLNLVRYNLFPRGTGSELYGTEEWHFYLKNLALNFNVALPLSLVALPVLLVLAFWNQWAASSEASLAAAGRARAALATQQFHNCVSALSWCAPYWLWLSFFSVLPHKEERFMFVVYPQLCLSAACAATVLQTAVLPPNPRDLAVSDTGASTPPLVAKSSSKTRKTCAASQASNTAHAAQRAAAAALLVPPFGHIGSALPPLQQQQQQQPRGLPPLQALLWMLGRLRSLALVCLLVASAGLGMSRSVALVSHYGAPLDAYAWLGNHLTKERSKLEWVHKLGLHDHEIRQASTLFPPPSVMVCVGKEWYRFSSHFLLPEGAQLSFVDGGFRGQLPRAFEHRPADKGDFKATRWPLAGSDTAARFFNEVPQALQSICPKGLCVRCGRTGLSYICNFEVMKTKKRNKFMSQLPNLLVLTKCFYSYLHR